MKRKNAVVTMLVLSLIFFAAWLVFYLLMALTSAPGFDFILPIYLKMLIDFSDPATLLFNILGWSVIGVWLILSIILIIVAAVKKRPAFIWGMFLLLFLLAPAFDYVALFDFYNTAILTLFSAFDVSILMISLIPFCGGLTVLFALILYILTVTGITPKATLEVANELAPEEEYIEEEPLPVEEEQEPNDVFEDLTVEPAPGFVLEEEPKEEVPEQEKDVEEEVNVEPEHEEVVEQPVVIEETKEEPKEDLKALLKEIVRDIVRDELARSQNPAQPNSNNNTVTGATFTGPLVVQYFNGCYPSQNPTQGVVQQTVQTTPVEDNKTEVVKESKPVVEQDTKPQTVSEPIAEVKEEPAVEQTAPVSEVVEEAPINEEIAEKKPIVRIPFEQRILDADENLQRQYNDLKNYILSFGLKCRTSNAGDNFRLHRKTYVKMTVAGKSLKLYLALDPADYADSKMPISDASSKAIYAEIPLVFKVKSDLSYRRALQLIQDACEKDGLEQGEVGKVNWVNEIRASFVNRVNTNEAEEDEEE